MQTWTFTTTDPDTALRLSTFCAGLGHVIETRTDTPNAAPAKAPARRKPAPVDHGCWRDPEGRKVRTRTLTGINARFRSNGSLSHYRPGNDAAFYAAAMGWTKEQAEAKIAVHRAHLDAFAAEQRGAR